MTEDFLNNAFELMGEESIVSIKVIKNKFTGEPAPYGFVHFDSDAAALMAMHKLNNKIIFDGRNLYDKKEMNELGYEYHCIG